MCKMFREQTTFFFKISVALTWANTSWHFIFKTRIKKSTNPKSMKTTFQKMTLEIFKFDIATLYINRQRTTIATSTIKTNSLHPLSIRPIFSKLYSYFPAINHSSCVIKLLNIHICFNKINQNHKQKQKQKPQTEK